MPAADAHDHWHQHARRWALVGPPLRPSPEDVAVVADAARDWARAHGRPPRVLLLGVTPELATLAWPDGTTLVALDHHAAMVHALFRPGAGRGAVVGDWLRPPLAPGTVDVVAGDGCLSCLHFPDGYRALADALAPALHADARLVLRLFAAPARAETLDDVAAALRAGAIGSLHALKWRLAMAVQPAHRNVPVEDIWRAFVRLVPDDAARAALAARTGWDRAVIDHVDVYRGSAQVYSFPTLDEARGALAGRLAERGCTTPRYELGERCPTLALAPRW